MSKRLRFEIGTLLQVELNVHGKNVILYGEVVREESNDDGSFKYGCQLNFLD
jgi:hypothetical protein